jgi:hypothetical protein
MGEGNGTARRTVAASLGCKQIFMYFIWGTILYGVSEIVILYFIWGTIPYGVRGIVFTAAFSGVAIEKMMDVPPDVAL